MAVKTNMHSLLRSAVALALAGAMTMLSACTAKTDSLQNGDILTQKPAQDGRTQITVLVKYAFSINGFEKAVEEKFPDIDIVQVGNYTRDMGVDEYVRRMKHDDLTDLVMTWPLDAGREYCDERLLDLSGYDFTSRYNLSMLNSISQDGKLYYLPGPSQVRGIVYNQTLFEEKGWKVPHDYEEFLELCQTIEASGMRSIQLGFKNAEVLDTAFVGYNYADAFSKPEDVQWIAEYNKGKGSFGDHFGSALDTFQQMIDAGIWKTQDLEINYAKRETMLFTRECAMLEDSVLMARMGEQLTGTKDKFALMPFFNPGKDSDWARLYMVCFVGANKHLADPENKKKYDLAIKLLDYISTPEGQEALASDTGAMYSSLIGVDPPSVQETKHLVSALSHGRYAIFPQLERAQNALREGLAGMVRGTHTKDDVIRMVDAQNRTPAQQKRPTVIGKATADFSVLETGNFVTDVMRESSGCDIALFLDNGKDGRYNGKGISASLYEGELTETDISCIMPDLKYGEKGVICKASMTGADLKKTLEYAIPVANDNKGWFYYFSGLQMQYNPVAEPGTRIKKITLQDGTAIDDKKVYTVAAMDATLPEELLQSNEQTDIVIANLLKTAIQEKKEIAPSDDNRFIIVK